jgi:AcrR family transcriptional regulator
MIGDEETSREAADEFGPGSTGSASESGDHPSRKERERIMHRGAILDAARDLLAVKPYDQITVHEIAAKAEFSVGYIYRLFESKEDIYVTLIRTMGDEMIGIMETHLGGAGSFDARLAGLVLAIYAWLDANPAFTANHAHEIHCLVRTLPRLGAAHLEREEIMQNKMRPFFESGIRAGVIEGDIDLMTRTLRALVWGFVGEDLFHGRQRSRWSEYAPIVVRAFMRTFAPEGGTK